MRKKLRTQYTNIGTQMRLTRKRVGGRKPNKLVNNLPYGEVRKVWLEDLLVGIVRSFRADSISINSERTNNTNVVNVQRVLDSYDMLPEFTVVLIEDELCISNSQAKVYMQVLQFADQHILRYIKSPEHIKNMELKLNKALDDRIVSLILE